MEVVQARSRFERILPAKVRVADPRQTLLRSAWHRLQEMIRTLSTNQGAHSIHDMRVQARSLRALLRALRSQIHPVRYAELRFDLSNLGRQLAETRQADAQLNLMRELSGTTKNLNTRDMLTMISLAERRALAARRSLVNRLQESAWSERTMRIGMTIDESELLLFATKHVRDECKAAMAGALRIAARELRDGQCHARATHRVRLRLKNARHACEQLQSLGEVQAERDVRNAIRSAGRAQESLGEVRDLEHLAKWVRKTPIPQALRRPLLHRIARRQEKLSKRFRRNRKALRKLLRASARSLSSPD